MFSSVVKRYFAYLGWNSAVRVAPCASKCTEAQLCVFRMQNDNQQGMLAKTVASCEAGYLRIVINFPKLNRLPILKVLCILATTKIDQD
jgi:hypothetical protein